MSVAEATERRGLNNFRLSVETFQTMLGPEDVRGKLSDILRRSGLEIIGAGQLGTGPSVLTTVYVNGDARRRLASLRVREAGVEPKPAWVGKPGEVQAKVMTLDIPAPRAARNGDRPAA